VQTQWRQCCKNFIAALQSITVNLYCAYHGYMRHTTANASFLCAVMWLNLVSYGQKSVEALDELAVTSEQELDLFYHAWSVDGLRLRP
jgi:hypothetical protein